MEYMEKYRELQQFKTVQEFDQYRSSVFYRIKEKLSKGAHAVWNVLAQHSVKLPGVCWIKINTIAKLADVSRSTVERSIRLFKKLGVIQVLDTTRPIKGGDGANVYVFQRSGEGAEMKGRQEAKNPGVAKDYRLNTKNKTKTLLSSYLNNNHLNNKRRPYIKFVPKSLQQFQTFFGQHVKTIYERVWLAAKKLDISVGQDHMQKIGFIALEQLKQYIKSGKDLTTEQLCKLAYKIAYNQLKQGIENKEILDISDFYKVLQRTKTIEESIPNSKTLNEMGVF